MALPNLQNKVGSYNRNAMIFLEKDSGGRNGNGGSLLDIWNEHKLCPNEEKKK